MNTLKVRQAIALLTDALDSVPPNALDCRAVLVEELGRAVIAALQDHYSLDSVVHASLPSGSWKPSAVRLWNAAKAVGLR